MREITLTIDGKEIKAQVSEEELKKLTAEPEWPQHGDRYWYISAGRVSTPCVWDGYENGFDCRQQAVGNCYRTEKEAKNALRAQKLIAAVAKRRKELNGDWKLDWENAEDKYFIHSYNGDLSPIGYMDSNNGSPFGHFKNSAATHTIIDEFKDELTWYFTEYLPSIN